MPYPRSTFFSFDHLHPMYYNKFSVGVWTYSHYERTLSISNYFQIKETRFQVLELCEFVWSFACLKATEPKAGQIPAIIPSSTPRIPLNDFLPRKSIVSSRIKRSLFPSYKSVLYIASLICGHFKFFALTVSGHRTMDEGFSEMISSAAKEGKDGDFTEEDVWTTSFMKEREGSSSKAKRAQDYSSAPAYRIIPAAPRAIPRLNSGSPCRYVTHQSSAPVNIPDWSKSYKRKSIRGLEDDAWAAVDGNGGNRLYFDDAEDDDGDEDSDEMVPPHEFIARRLARSPVVSFSMCEGVGRTLKGRDLSKLRNAILTKTGFLE